MNKNISKIVVIICIIFLLFLVVRFLFGASRITVGSVGERLNSVAFGTEAKEFGKNKNTNNAGHIVFLGKDETIRHLKWADDGYFQTFSKVDYTVRNIRTIDDYYKIIEQSVDQFSEEQKREITECILAADAFFETKRTTWFDVKKCNAIPWKIGCIKKLDQSNTYEEGLPHTRTDLILLPKTMSQNPGSLTRLLIHEKIHIYQKMYKADVLAYLNESGFTKHERKSTEDTGRANPDIDNWTYKDKNGEIYKSQYLDGAKSIHDVTFLSGNDQTSEHPFEKMAIEMSKMYM
jgi:hypothetical protein